MEVPGDPLTGHLPRTRLIVPQDVYGPVRIRKPRRDPDEWPRTADPIGITIRQIAPGKLAAVRTRFGVRTWVVRTVNKSYEMRNKGRHYITGMDRNSGLCHSAWIEHVISVDTARRALLPGK